MAGPSWSLPVTTPLSPTSSGVTTADNPSADPSAPIDFIFLVDLSGSFGDDLPNFQEAAPSIAAAVTAIDADARFAIASFVDLPVSPFGSATSGDYVYRADLGLTHDDDAFQDAIGDLRARFGSDFEEAQWSGLFGAAGGVGLGLREDSRKIVLLATDATAHTAADYGLSPSGVAGFLTDNVLSGNGPVSDAADPEVDATFGPGIGDPLLRAAAETVIDADASLIFAVTADVQTFYQDAADAIGAAAAVTELSRSGTDISDAVSVALSTLLGDVTDTGGSANELLTGTPGDDGLFGLGGNDTILGLAGDDLLDGGAGDDDIEGGDGDDELRGGTGADDLRGGAGDDLLLPGLGGASGGLGATDRVSGGEGSDTVSGTLEELDRLFITDLEAEDAIVIRLASIASVSVSGPVPAASSPASVASAIEPSSFPTDPSDQDTQFLFDEDGDGLSDASLWAAFDATGLGFELTRIGGDTIYARTDSSIAGRLFLDADRDGVDEGDAGLAGATVTLADTLGRAFRTTTTAEDGSYLFDDLPAASYTIRVPTDLAGRVLTLTDAGGDDARDSDVSRVNGLTPTLVLGYGEDLTDVDAGYEGGVPTGLIGSTQPDTLIGTAGDDVADGKNGPDVIRGGDGDDILRGGNGDDVVRGGSGNDVVRGGFGDDFVKGGWGEDLVNGGRGDDVMAGGRDADVFVYDGIWLAEAGNDTILDFVAREDRIDLRNTEVAATRVEGRDLVLDLTSGGTLTLADAGALTLTSDDFL
jgi:Ca2+-binding RTX toxin-like protein